eukprot:gene18406-21956_t
MALVAGYGSDTSDSEEDNPFDAPVSRQMTEPEADSDSDSDENSEEENEANRSVKPENLVEKPPEKLKRSVVLGTGEKGEVKEREKKKRMLAQNGRDAVTWKSEEEMILRQQFDC